LTAPTAPRIIDPDEHCRSQQKGSVMEEIPCRYSPFRWELYDWNKFDPLEYGYNVIRLGGSESSNRKKSLYSGTYFSVVTYSNLFNIARYLRMAVLPWWPRIKIENGKLKSIYARTRVLDPWGFPTDMGMHELIALDNHALGMLGFEEYLDVVDHIKSVGLDNRDENLRPATYSLNSRNVMRDSDVMQLKLDPEWAKRERDHVPPIIFPPLKPAP
jgi:hypothetical protein